MEAQSNETEFKSSHNLPFLVAEYTALFGDGYDWYLFKIGTCEGLWSVNDTHYNILAIDNKEVNNGHFNDVLEWFEYCCKKYNRKLKILEIWNSKFKNHLVEKRGFIMLDDFNAEKNY